MYFGISATYTVFLILCYVHFMVFILYKFCVHCVFLFCISDMHTFCFYLHKVPCTLCFLLWIKCLVHLYTYKVPCTLMFLIWKCHVHVGVLTLCLELCTHCFSCFVLRYFFFMNYSFNALDDNLFSGSLGVLFLP